MLALTRTAGQALVVEGPCRIVVIKSKGDRVVLGVDAKPGIAVYREEMPAEAIANLQLRAERASGVGGHGADRARECLSQMRRPRRH